MRYVTLTIDDQSVRVPRGTTLLSAAKRAGCDVPTLCHLPGRKPRAVCRICVVERRDNGRLVPACATDAEEGMVIETNSKTVSSARRTLMEFILAEHGECDDPGCQVEQLAAEIGVSDTRFEAPHQECRSGLSSDFVRVKPERCIHCDRCIQACSRDRQVLARSGRGADVVIAFDDDQAIGDSSCTTCGDCVAVCPAGGLLAKAEK